MRILWSIALSLICIGAGRADEVLLRLDGIQNSADADAVKDALARIESVKIAIAPTKEKPEARVAFDPGKSDVGDLAKAVAGKTPASIVLAYNRLDSSAVGDEAYLPPKFAAGLAKLKEVDAKKSTIDFKKRQFIIRLDPAGGAKLADIQKGFGGVMLTTP